MTTTILIQIFKTFTAISSSSMYIWFIFHFFYHYDDDIQKHLIKTNNDNLPSDEVSWKWDDWNLMKQKIYNETNCCLTFCKVYLSNRNSNFKITFTRNDKINNNTQYNYDSQILAKICYKQNKRLSCTT